MAVPQPDTDLPSVAAGSDAQAVLVRVWQFLASQTPMQLPDGHRCMIVPTLLRADADGHSLVIEYELRSQRPTRPDVVAAVDAGRTAGPTYGMVRRKPGGFPDPVYTFSFSDGGPTEIEHLIQSARHGHASAIVAIARAGRMAGDHSAVAT